MPNDHDDESDYQKTHKHGFDRASKFQIVYSDLLHEITNRLEGQILYSESHDWIPSLKFHWTLSSDSQKVALRSSIRYNVFMLSLLLLSACADLSILEDDIEMNVQTWCAPNEEVDVSRVYDGDTFMFWENDAEIKIRMLGVAAPEVDPVECYGAEAGDFLEDLLVGEEVRLEFDVECVDIYNRTLAWVILRGNDPEIAELITLYDLEGLYSDGSYELLVNELLVRMGYATVFDGEVDQSIRYKTRMEDAEDASKAQIIGLWQECE